MAWSDAARAAALEARRHKRAAHKIPAVVYHGGKVRGLRRLEPYEAKTGPKGIYTTSSAGAASAYSGKSGEIYRLHLRIRNPLDITGAIKYGRSKGLSFGDAKRRALLKLRKEHDAIVFHGNAANTPEFVVFKKWQARMIRARK